MAWYNPSTWAPVDQIQNQFRTFGSFGSRPGQGGATIRNPGFSSRPSTIRPTNRSSPARTPGPSRTPSTQRTTAVRTGIAAATSAPDPYARWGGQDAYNRLRAGFDTQKGNIYGSARDAASMGGRQIEQGILDFFQNASNTQKGINRRGELNELAKKQGTTGILGDVSRGLRSGGTMLAQKNATNSSAAGEIAKAYGDIGRRGLTQVGQQYAMENRGIADVQDSLNQEIGTYADRRYGAQKEQIVGNIVNDARNKLAQLDAARMDAGLEDRLAIDQEKEAIRREVLGQLSQYDQLLQQKRGEIRASTSDERMAAANAMAAEGMAPEGAFQFGTEAPAQFAGTGPFAGDLPLFTLRRPRPDQAVA